MLTGKDSAYGSQQISILCGDNAAARDPEVYWRQIRASRAAQPLFGPLATNISLCGFWPTAPREQPTQIGNGVRALIVQSDGDPVTRCKHGLAMYRALTGSRMLTLRGVGVHAVYTNYGNACIDARVNSYLATGQLPAQDITCG